MQKMVEGRLAKFYEEVCLLEQPFVMDPQTKIGALLEAAGREFGYPLQVRGFVRYALGEGVEQAAIRRTGGGVARSPNGLSRGASP